MFTWLEDAPVYGFDSEYDITSFIDQIIDCDNDLELRLLVNGQIHMHPQTCRQ